MSILALQVAIFALQVSIFALQEATRSVRSYNIYAVYDLALQETARSAKMPECKIKDSGMRTEGRDHHGQINTCSANISDQSCTDTLLALVGSASNARV